MQRFYHAVRSGSAIRVFFPCQGRGGIVNGVVHHGVEPHSVDAALHAFKQLRQLLQIGRSSLSFELPLSFEQAAAYRKANGQYVRKNQWRDTTVRVFIDLD